MFTNEPLAMGPYPAVDGAVGGRRRRRKSSKKHRRHRRSTRKGMSRKTAHLAYMMGGT